MPLPPPSALPQLRDLTITQQGVWTGANETQLQEQLVVARSVGAYAPQLTSLSFWLHPNNAPVASNVWDAVLTPATASQTLTRIETKVHASRDFIKLLLSHTPSLQSLSVARVSMHTDELKDRQWEVSELYIDILDNSTLSCLARLPSVRQGRVKIGVAVNSIQFESQEQVSMSMLHRCPSAESAHIGQASQINRSHIPHSRPDNSTLD